LEETGISDAF